MTKEHRIGLNPLEILSRVSAMEPGQSVRLEFETMAKLKAFRSSLYLTRSRENDRILRELVHAVSVDQPTTEMPLESGWEEVTTASSGRVLRVSRLGPDDVVKITWPAETP